MKKLSAWQIVLLVIFYPVGICVLIYRIWKKRDLEKKAQAEREIKNRKEAARKAQYEAELAARETCTFKVVGVTFKNEDGKSRQTLLRKLKFDESPFNDEDGIDVEIEETVYEGAPAYCVYVNNLQIGNIGKSDIPFFVERYRDLVGVSSISVSGGGSDDEGNLINYGATIDCVFRGRR